MDVATHGTEAALSGHGKDTQLQAGGESRSMSVMTMGGGSRLSRVFWTEGDGLCFGRRPCSNPRQLRIRHFLGLCLLPPRRRLLLLFDRLPSASWGCDGRSCPDNNGSRRVLKGARVPGGTAAGRPKSTRGPALSIPLKLVVLRRVGKMSKHAHILTGCRGGGEGGAEMNRGAGRHPQGLLLLILVHSLCLMQLLVVQLRVLLLDSSAHEMPSTLHSTVALVVLRLALLLSYYH